MQYFAGMFDAEGYVSINSKGGFRVAIEMANEQIPIIFKKEFGGCINNRKRRAKKPTSHWVCSSNEETNRFIDNILPFSIVKRQQLLLLQQYLAHRREERSNIRKHFISSISECKIPDRRNVRFCQVKTFKNPSEDFFKWLAGFIDGDGNFSLYESYKRFNIQICVFNVFPQPIKEIKSNIEGSICLLNREPNPLWKWTASNYTDLCPKILPYLRIKKTQCEIFMEFLENKKTWSHSEEYRIFVRSLIQKLKHANSL